MLEKQKAYWLKDQEYISDGRKDAFGFEFSKSKLIREPVVPKSTKNHLSLTNTLFKQTKRDKSFYSKKELKEL